ncbi:hypothetical protein BJF83_16185 [Nocardiopsis sp. CNR-923]|uniref:hypothetical protein n=1 Tax=Nocardiopsis sp. CNR-923 TaxID=1904965 RepID=UPI0009680E22|nr:hypothetical protein [Nocardiopsis sp. CNR-923]OLT28060.1 hypothetical protein BJF83_16185 [Nocardiopsis sp. CNR-923]
MRRAAAFARLTGFNVRRFLVQPFLYLGTAVSAALVYAAQAGYHRPSALDVANTTESAALAVAATMFAATTFPAVREARYSGSVVAPLGRTGRLLSLLVAAALVTVVCQAAVAVLCHLVADGPQLGAVSPYARAVPFALALAGPAASVAAAMWTRSYAQIIVPAVILPGYLLYLDTALASAGPQVVHRVQSLAVLSFDPFSNRSPSITVLSGLYLVYALLLVGLFVSVALTARPRRGAARGIAAGACAVLAAGALATPVYANAVYGWDHRFPDSALHGTTSCEVREGITYCPLPGFEGLVDKWHDALGPPLALLPEEARDRFPVVWQDGESFTRDFEAPEGRGVVTYDLGLFEEPYFRPEIISGGARVVLGLPDAYAEPCWATGQARLPLMVWLTTVSSGDAAEPWAPNVNYQLTAFGPSKTDLVVAGALAELPDERVAEVLSAHWDTLSSPEGRTTDLAGLLDLPVPAGGDRLADADDWRRHDPWHYFDPEADLPPEDAGTCD